jgi:hypothetical protein
MGRRLFVMNPLLALIFGSRLLIEKQTGLSVRQGWLAREDLLFTEKDRP